MSSATFWNIFADLVLLANIRGPYTTLFQKRSEVKTRNEKLSWELNFIETYSKKFKKVAQLMLYSYSNPTEVVLIPKGKAE